MNHDGDTDRMGMDMMSDDMAHVDDLGRDNFAVMM
jgi:hypothetical protein